MGSIMRLVPPGLALIATSYGLARFAYGLFLPEMRDDVGLTPAFAGIIGGGSYLGYCIAIILSAFLVEKLGPRVVSISAGLVATLGMALIAVSESPWVLASAVLFAGMSTGLASPPMADAVARVVPDEAQPRANTLINSGTSVGVALSGPIALTATGQWREAYLLFSLIAAAVTVWLAFCVPGNGTATSTSTPKHLATTNRPTLLRREAVPVIVAATGMGFASAVYWTFAGDVIATVGGLSRGVSSLAWVVIGVAGLIGGMAGDLIGRFEINGVHRSSLVTLAMAILALALAPTEPVLVLSSAVLFGAAYIMLTGVYLVWGVRVYRDRPAIGLTLPFLMIALGQVLGAPIGGVVIGVASHTVAFTSFAVVAIVTTLAVYRGRSSVQLGPHHADICRECS